MKNKQILKMLEELICEIDYDIYKDMFVNIEDPESVKEHKETLITIVRKHLPRPEQTVKDIPHEIIPDWIRK